MVLGIQMPVNKAGDISSDVISSKKKKSIQINKIITGLHVDFNF